MTILILVTILLAVGLGAAFYLLATVKGEVAQLRTLSAAQQSQLEKLAATSERERAQWQERCELLALQGAANSAAAAGMGGAGGNGGGPGAAADSGLNLAKRSQALRLLRSGTAVEAIASDLQISKSEVRLLRKVNQILASSAEASA